MKSSLSSVRRALSACASPIKTAAVFAGISLAALHAASAAVIPYTNDFSGTGDNVAFPNENTDSNWTVTGGSYAFTYPNGATTPTSASISLTNVGNISFTMTTQFSVGSTPFVMNSNGITLGMGLFGSDANFTGGSTTSYYLVDWQIGNTGGTDIGKLRFLSLGDNAGFTTQTDGFADDNASSPTLAINLNTSYTMRVDGVYSNGTLVMALGVYNASGVQIGTSTTVTDTSPLTGTFFGYRNRAGIGSGSLNANFDNFSVIPEPGTVTMFALGAGAVLYGLRRRKIA